VSICKDHTIHKPFVIDDQMKGKKYFALFPTCSYETFTKFYNCQSMAPISMDVFQQLKAASFCDL